MNIRLLFLLIVLIGVGTSCSNDDEPIPPEPIPVPKPEPEPDPEKPVFLNIIPTIDGMQQTRSGIITQFASEDKIGLFLTSGELGNNYEDIDVASNLPASFTGKDWSIKTPVELSDKKATMYSYYPYSELVTDGTKIPIEIASQTDYLFGTKAVAQRTAPEANITMKHALALVSVKVLKNDYEGLGKLSRFTIDGIKTEGFMNISDGSVIAEGNAVSFSHDCDITLDDDNPLKTSIISFPLVVSETSGVQFKVNIDGLNYSFDVPVSHIWKQGFEYIYTLNLHKEAQQPTPDDVKLDVEYWSKFGKEDNIVVGENSTSMLRITTNYQSFGKTVVRNEGKDFAVFVYNYGDTFEGKVRMALFDGDNLVEQYQPYNISIASKKYDGYRIPCFVQAPAGTYQLKPLFQVKGSTEWLCPRYSSTAEDIDWKYTVSEESNTPSLRTINLEGERVVDLIFPVTKREPFNIEYKLSNRAAVALHGEIKAVWERNFGDFYNITEDDGISWADEIGRMRIDLDANVRYYNGKITCNILNERPTVERCTPDVHLYFKADGSTDWKLMRNDCDNVFEAMKGIVDYRIYDNDGFVIDGLDYVLIHNKATNYVSVKLK